MHLKINEDCLEEKVLEEEISHFKKNYPHLVVQLTEETLFQKILRYLTRKVLLVQEAKKNKDTFLEEEIRGFATEEIKKYGGESIFLKSVELDFTAKEMNEIRKCCYFKDSDEEETPLKSNSQTSSCEACALRNYFVLRKQTENVLLQVYNEIGVPSEEAIKTFYLDNKNDYQLEGGFVAHRGVVLFEDTEACQKKTDRLKILFESERERLATNWKDFLDFVKTNCDSFEETGVFFDVATLTAEPYCFGSEELEICKEDNQHFVRMFETENEVGLIFLKCVFKTRGASFEEARNRVTKDLMEELKAKKLEIYFNRLEQKSQITFDDKPVFSKKVF